MKVELKDVTRALKEAVETARDMPEAEVATIINPILGVLGDGVDDEETGAVKKAAHDRLHAAAGQLAEQGETLQAPMTNALIGIGLALLAGGEDAEAYYAAVLSGAGDAS